MAVEGKSDHSSAGRFRLRKFLIVVTLIFVLIGGLLSLLPYAIEKGAVSWLQQHGVDDARIDNVDLNLFSGEAVVEGLKSGDGLNIDHLSFDFDWLPLWHHIVHIRTLKLSESSLSVLEQKGIWQVAGIEPAADESALTASQQTAQGNPWLVVVDDLLLDTVNVNVKSDLFSFSLPLKSLRLSLSGLQGQQQKMVNHIEIGDTTFSGFGYSIRLADAKLAGEVAFSILSKDIAASLKSNKLSLALQRLEIRSEHDKRQLSAAALTFDGIALGGKDGIHVASTAVNKLRIRHALNGQGQVRLAGVKISAVDVGLGGDMAVAKIELNELSTEGFAGKRQSLLIAKTVLAGLSTAPSRQSINKSGKHAAQYIHIKSLDMKNIAVKHALDERGELTLKRVNLHALNIGLDGSIAVAKLALKKLSAEGFDKLQQALSIEDTVLTGVSMTPALKKAVQHVRIKSLDVKNIALKHAANDGSVTVKRLNLATLDVGLDGSVALAKLSLQQMKADALTSDNHSLRLEGAKLAELSIRSGETIRLKTLSLHKGDLFGPDQSGLNRKQLLGAFENAGLEQFAMTGSDTGSFELFKLEGVQLPSAGNMSLGSVGLIQASNAVLEKGGIYRVKQLKLAQLQAHLVKQKNGWLLPSGMAKEKPGSSTHDGDVPSASFKKTDASVAQAQLIIDEVVIDAGSQIELHDESVTPQLATTMQIEQFHFAPLDSSGNQRGKLDVKMKLGKSGSLSLQGTTNIAAGKQLRTDMHLVLENFDLPRLSGYVEADLGKSIKTGQFNLDSDISIKNNSIDSKNKVLIRKLALVDSHHANKSGPKISLAGGMSVDMALGMLQDDRGDVKLNVPINGPLDNPDVKLNHIINKALLTSLKTGALTYAALALQPYGSIILVADVARGIIKEAAKPKLTPIDFAERQSVLTAQMNDYISKIATMMEKKDFRLQVCGIATRIEGEMIMQPAAEAVAGEQPGYVAQPALDDAQLLELAQQRSDVVVAALHALGVADKQVFNCHPGIDEKKGKAQARVELLLDY